MAVFASILALGLGGAAIGCGSNSDSGSDSGGQVEQTEDSSTASSATTGENGTVGTVEHDEDVTSQEAERAATAAEKATGGQATEVERKGGTTEPVKSTGAKNSKAQALKVVVFEVEIDQGGQEVDVYLNEAFETIAIKQ